MRCPASSRAAAPAARPTCCSTPEACEPRRLPSVLAQYLLMTCLTRV
jgi:hypothetical protein